MQLHQIKPKTKKKRAKKVGRGGKRGTYSGKGLKGQKARAGRKMRPELRDILKKIPKKRGYRFQSFRQKPSPVNLGALEAMFKTGETVSPETLFGKGIVQKEKKFLPVVKILGSGEISKKLKVSGCIISKTAKEKIEKAGGEIIIK